MASVSNPRLSVPSNIGVRVSVAGSPIKQSAQPRLLLDNGFRMSLAPTDEEIDIMLELMMEDVNLVDNKKKVLRTLAHDRKWMMLVQNLGERYRVGSQEVVQEIKEIQNLREGPDLELLTRLVVSLRSRPIQWISEFIKHGGLGVLLDNLNELQEAGRHDELEEMYIKCLKSFMNNKIGLSAVLETDGAMNVIALSLRSPLLRTKALVLEIFGAVCLLPGGHKSVLDGLDAVCAVAGTRFRFELVVHALWQSCFGHQGPDKDLQIASMSFVNAVTCGGPGASLDFRMHIRWEFLNLGLLTLCDNMTYIENDLLQTQIDLWISGLENDETEIFQKIGAGEFDTEDLEEFSKALNKHFKSTTCEIPYFSILKHLTLLPTSSYERSRFIFIIDKMIQQLILQKHGEDFDPAVAVANLDMTKLIGDAENISNSPELDARYQKMVEKCKRLQKELDQALKVGGNEKRASGDQAQQPIAAPPPVIMGGPPPPGMMGGPPPPPGMMGGPPPPPPPGMIGGPPPPPPGMMGGPPPLPPPGMMGGPPPPPPPGMLGGPPPPPGMMGGPPPPPGMMGGPPPPPPGMMGGPPGPPPPPGMMGGPPPPPPGMMGGPPGPPPPPGMMGGPPGPPRPPGAVGFAPPPSNQPPAKPTNLSSKPLKSFNWVKVAPTKVKDTVWEKIDDAVIHKKLKGNAYNEFEELFAAKEAKALEASADKAEQAGPKEITFLDGKRSQNINIMLKAIKLDPSLIKNAILTVNTTILPPFVLTELLKLTPTDEEIGMVKEYKNDFKNLASAERFIYEVADITKYEQKLNSLLFKATFDEYQDDAETMISNLKRANTDVMQSEKFKEVLKIVLALGNYLNPGQRGGAYGFKMASLLKLADTRSTLTARKHTLLHYLHELLEKEFPDIVDFHKELSNVEDGSKVGIPATRMAVNAIRDKIKTLKTLLEAEDAAQTKNKFLQLMNTFHDEATAAYEKLNTAFQDAEKKFEEAVNFYGEEPKNTTPEDFFGTFAKFVKAYQSAKEENEAAKAKLETEKKREETKKQQEEMKTKKMEEANSKTNANIQKEGGLDDLISSIRTGKAFGNNEHASVNRQRRQRAPSQSKKTHARNPSEKVSAELAKVLVNQKGPGSTPLKK